MEITDPKPGKWYYTMLDWPAQNFYVWAQQFPYCSPSFECVLTGDPSYWVHSGLSIDLPLPTVYRWRFSKWT